MKAVVFAYHDVGCRGVRVLSRLGVEIALVYTHADDPVEETWFGSVQSACAELGIPVAVGADPNDAAEIARLRSLRPDALFGFYYRNILCADVLETGLHGAVNLHGSLLPRYRGRAPVNWMILHGEREGGVTLHDMVARPDAGDIIDQEAFAIGPDDRPTDVYSRLVDAAEVVVERSALAVLSGTARRTQQLESNATTFGRRRPADGRIDFRLSAENVRNLVRAVTHPYPGAFAFAGSRRVTIWWAEHTDSAEVSDAPAGTVRHVASDVLVTCGDGRSLRLVDVDLDGGRLAQSRAGALGEGIVLTPQPQEDASWTS